MLAPYFEWLTGDIFWKYGPSLLFIGLGILFFWKTKPEAATQTSVEDARAISVEPVALNKPIIAAVELVASGDEMVVVITPAFGGVTVGIFVVISYFQTSMISAAWSHPSKFYLGEAVLRAADVKISKRVMKFDGITNGWLFASLDAEGEPSGSQPCFIGGKLRLTLTFEYSDKIDKFDFLLVRQSHQSADPPTVLTHEDFVA